MIIFIFSAIFILIGYYSFNHFLLEYLNYIVGITLFVGSVISVIHDFVNKKYYNDENHVASHIIGLIISFLLLFVRLIYKGPNLDITCILWGIVVITNSSLNLNFSVYEISHKQFYFAELLETLLSIAQIILSVLLIMEPHEHVQSHIILLAIEYAIEAFIIFDHILKKDILKRHTLIK